MQQRGESAVHLQAQRSGPATPGAARALQEVTCVGQHRIGWKDLI